MASTGPLSSAAPVAKFLRLFHGTDRICANDLFVHGIAAAAAAMWNGSGEFGKAEDECDVQNGNKDSSYEQPDCTSLCPAQVPAKVLDGDDKPNADTP